MSETLWQFWIDVGGTFTDCMARSPNGQLRRHKCLSSGVTKGTVGPSSDRYVVRDPLRCGDPNGFWQGSLIRLLDERATVLAESEVAEFDPSQGALRLDPPLTGHPELGKAYELVTHHESPILGIRYLLGLRPLEPIPPISVRLGTTRATNALLTRQGAATALVTTKGFADILTIGYQNRPALFTLDIQKPAPLFSAVVEIAERVASDGEILVAPRPEAILEQLRSLRASGIESLAICLLHADRFPAHEELVERLAKRAGFSEISRSSDLAPVIRMVPRGDTTVVDAYLNPVLRSYLHLLKRSLAAGSDVRVLTSAGSLVEVDGFKGKDSILSGPAGGVVGVARVAEAVGFQRAIGFDMGGTSTDVSRFDDRFELDYEGEKAGVRVVTPMLAIETVAAGGGSICGFDGVKLVVGPASAGADPGPACYGRGGPLALTDVNFFLGRILADQFPFRLDRMAVKRRLATLLAGVRDSIGREMSEVQLAEGFLRVANRNMSRAIRSVSVSKGYDPQDYLLIAFGGAAPQHACAVADQLQMRQILCHRDAGILSAYGVGMADTIRHGVAGIYRDYDESTGHEMAAVFRRLADVAQRDVLAEGVPVDQIEVRDFLDLRYRGTDVALTVDRPADDDYASAFAQAHQRLYGYLQPTRQLEVVAARVEVTGRSSTRPCPSQRVSPTRPVPAAVETQMLFDGGALQAGVYQRQELSSGDALSGPALVVEDTSITVIDPAWSAEMLSGGELLLTRQAGAPCAANQPPGSQNKSPSSRSPSSRGGPDPVMLEIFNCHFAGIAEQMGITLQRTACSVNVKERLDFSCAIFTAEGDLVVNAPHIPVHLGAMSETVKRAISQASLSPGDALVSNDPYGGGSHLPDITVITPVHDPATQALRFLTASRAHHAEVGGIAPGSMSPFSTNLAEEGVLIKNFRVVHRGESHFEELRDLLTSGPFPSRDPDTNLADISAQLASNRRGADDLLELIQLYGWETVAGNMQHIQHAAEQQVRTTLGCLPDGQHTFIDHLDDGAPIQLTVTIQGQSATLDFTGTGETLANNFNANRAIVTAAVMYCLRCLIKDDIPLNQGVLVPVEIVLPECFLNPPVGQTAAECAAVAAGNVETSQRIVDVILGALNAAAASQGTMNNVIFGDDTFAYYETICGGAGATATANGATAVQTHMTNTRITDPEVLEQRYPVRVREFSIRRGSGGAGRHRGGDGIIRRLEFLGNLTLSVLSQRRGPYPPYGLAGGQSGALGINELKRREGSVERLAGTVQTTVRAGDELTVMTPGGGGHG